PRVPAADRPAPRILVIATFAPAPEDGSTSPQPAMHHRLKLPRSYFADRTLLAVLIATGAWLGLTGGRGPTEVAPIWVGNGILAGWLLSRRTADWPGYLAVALAAELTARFLTGDAP